MLSVQTNCGDIVIFSLSSKSLYHSQKRRYSVHGVGIISFYSEPIPYVIKHKRSVISVWKSQYIMRKKMTSAQSWKTVQSKSRLVFSSSVRSLHSPVFWFPLMWWRCWRATIARTTLLKWWDKSIPKHGPTKILHPRLVAMADAAFRNNSDISSQRAMVIFMAEPRREKSRNIRGCLIFFESTKITRTTLSTTVAELYALMKCY